MSTFTLTTPTEKDKKSKMQNDSNGTRTVRVTTTTRHLPGNKRNYTVGYVERRGSFYNILLSNI